jgi:alkanesulfonate monooxygenase SsuD/methylene tetrahydromethanopterin reductase-like flavin-dependent oxidoreductase (luciferase family)
VEIAIGLPNAVAGTSREDLLEFARRADARGFSSLGTLDRVVYDNYEPLAALAAAAAVTERIRLATTVLLAPLRPNAAVLAKEALTIDALSGGRFVLGLAIGGREDDYEASGIPMSERGERLDAQLEQIERVWSQEIRGTAGSIGPRRHGRPTLWLGGSVQASFRRAARYGDGWMASGGPPEAFEEAVPKVKAAWAEAGRDGQPKLAALNYYALGPQAEEHANRDLRHYYAWLGEEVAGWIADSAATDEEQVRGMLAAFEALGCDEFFLFPAASDPEQVDLLADAVGK